MKSYGNYFLYDTLAPNAYYFSKKQKS